MSYTDTIVLSLGGSLIVPNGGIDTQFLSQFNQFIRQEIASKRRRFFIICGGGATARHYIKAGVDVVAKPLTDEDKDWLGIHSTRLNAHLVRTIFQDIAYPHIFKHYDRDYDIADEPIVVCSGWKPGWSTDYCAVLVAQKYGAKTLVNLSNVDKVYDKDPRKFKDAKPIDKMSWSHFEKLIGNKWVPGLNAPFDPIATKLAKKLDLSVIILNGRNLKNVAAAIDGRKFVGTVIAPFTLDASFYDRSYYGGDKGEYANRLYLAFQLLLAFFRAAVIRLFFHPKSVLDVGCGLGYLVYFLRKFGIDAYGVEISPYALSHAYSQAKNFIKNGDIRDIPYPAGKFDLVTSFHVLEHIYQEDIPKAVGECSRVAAGLQLHKVSTLENSWTHRFVGTDLSRVSVFSRDIWWTFFKDHRLTGVTQWWPKIPETIETSFLLRKK